jgi:hypothetical protein
MDVVDKIKAQAEQMMARGKTGVAQGRAKFDAMQAKKSSDALLRDLGAAYYAKERKGGSAADVDAALAKVAEHEAKQSRQVDLTDSAETSAPTTGGSTP